MPSKTEVAKGESFTLNILVDEAAGVAGCAFTLVYPQTVLTLADTPVTTKFFKLFYDENQGADPAQIYPWEKNTGTTGEIRLSGAYINTDSDTGGGGKYSGSQTLFTLFFSVKDDATAGSYNFELKQTQLCNGPLGWGTDNNNGQYDEVDGDVKEGAPILVKSFAKGSDQWNTFAVSDDFETLLSSFETNPQTSFEVLEDGFTLNLQAARNLLALPTVSSDTSASLILAGIKDNVASSWKWENNIWAVYLPSFTQSELSAYISSKGFSEMTTITCGECFWVNSETSQTLSMQGTQPQDASLSLSSGWNLIGLKSNQTKSITDLVSGKKSDIASICKWENNNWAVYLPGGGTATYATSKGFNVLEDIEPNEGLWVNTTKVLTLD